MAYQESFNDDDKKKAAGEQDLTSSETVVNPGATNTSSAGGSTTQPAKANSGSGWVNLNKYVDANKEQASGMADTVTGGLNTTKTGLQGTQDAFSSDFGKQIDQGTVKNDNSLSTMDPTKNSQAWTAQYQKMTGGYQGPTDVTKDTRYGDLSSGWQNMGQQVGNLTSNEGRATTAADTFGKMDNNYSKGENTLDSFLLGSGDAGKKLQDFSSAYQQADPSKAWTGLVGGLNGQIDAGKATSEATAAAANDALGEQLHTLNGRVDNGQYALDAEGKRSQQTYDRLSKALTTGNLTEQANAFKEIGIDPNIGFQLKDAGIDLSQLIGKGTSRKLGDVVDPDTVAALQALSGLAGQQVTQDFSTSGAQAIPYTVNQGLVDQGTQMYQDALAARQPKLTAPVAPVVQDASSRNIPSNPGPNVIGQLAIPNSGHDNETHNVYVPTKPKAVLSNGQTGTPDDKKLNPWGNLSNYIE